MTSLLRPLKIGALQRTVAFSFSKVFSRWDYPRLGSFIAQELMEKYLNMPWGFNSSMDGWSHFLPTQLWLQPLHLGGRTRLPFEKLVPVRAQPTGTVVKLRACLLGDVKERSRSRDLLGMDVRKTSKY
jgi:hypothetical protein